MITKITGLLKGASVVPVYADNANGGNKSYTRGSTQNFVLFFPYDAATLPDISTVTGTWAPFSSNALPHDDIVINNTSDPGVAFAEGDMLFYNGVFETNGSMNAGVFATDNARYVVFALETIAAGASGLARVNGVIPYITTSPPLGNQGTRLKVLTKSTFEVATESTDDVVATVLNGTEVLLNGNIIDKHIDDPHLDDSISYYINNQLDDDTFENQTMISGTNFLADFNLELPAASDDLFDTIHETGNITASTSGTLTLTNSGRYKISIPSMFYSIASESSITAEIYVRVRIDEHNSNLMGGQRTALTSLKTVKATLAPGMLLLVDVFLDNLDFIVNVEEAGSTLRIALVLESNIGFEISTDDTANRFGINEGRVLIERIRANT